MEQQRYNMGLDNNPNNNLDKASLESIKAICGVILCLINIVAGIIFFEFNVMGVFLSIVLCIVSCAICFNVVTRMYEAEKGEEAIAFAGIGAGILTTIIGIMLVFAFICALFLIVLWAIIKGLCAG